MANSKPWQVLLGGEILAEKSTAKAALNAGDREARSFAVRHSAFPLRVRHRTRGIAYERRGGSWIRTDSAAPTRPVPRSRRAA